VGDQAALSFGELLRRLRVEARLTQEELAQTAKLSPRAVSDLERGIHRTARKDTAELLADALDLAGPARELFVAAARDRSPAEDVLAARDGMTSGAGHKAALQLRRCPYRGLLPFGESDAEVFYGRERLAAELAVKVAARAGGAGLVVVTGASGSGKSSLLRAGLLPILARGQQVAGSDRWLRVVMTPTKEPLTELAARLAALGGPDALAVRDGLARHPDQAHLVVRSAVLAAAARRDEELPGPMTAGPWRPARPGRSAGSRPPGGWPGALFNAMRGMFRHAWLMIVAGWQRRRAIAGDEAGSGAARGRCGVTGRGTGSRSGAGHGLPDVSRSTGRLASAGGNNSQPPSRRQAATPVMAVASGAPLAQMVSGRMSASVPAPASGAVRRVATIPVQ